MENIFLKIKFNNSLIILVIILLFIENRLYAQPQWNLINPRINGNITSLFFVNPDKGWASANNTIYKTNDGGITFFPQTIGKSFVDASFIDYTNGFIIKSDSIFYTTDSGENWNFFASPVNESIRNIIATSTNNLFISTSSGLFVTDDGGTNWDTLLTKNIKSFSVVNKNIWAATNDSVYKSTNEGISWDISLNSLIPDVIGGILKVQFLDSLNGIVSSHFSISYYTTNGGSTWNSVGVDDGFEIFDISLATNNIKILARRNDGGDFLIYHFIISGTPSQYAVFDWDIKKIFSFDENNYWIYGNNGMLIKYNNNTDTWDYLSFSSNTTITGIYNINDSTEITLEHYDYEKSGLPRQLLIIKKTNNYGRTWQNLGPILLYEGAPYDEMASQFLDDSTGFMCQIGYFFKTTDGGLSWQHISNYYTNGVSTYMYFLNDSIGWVTDIVKLVKTTDGGMTWNTQVNFGGNNYFNSVYFINKDTGFATIDYGGKDSILFKCTDGGNNWQEFSLNNKKHLNFVKFINDSVGFVIGDSGTIYKTTDSGVNWSNITTNINDNLNLLSNNGNIVCVSGTSVLTNSVFISSNEGDSWTDTNFPQGGVTHISVTPSNFIYASSESKIYLYSSQSPVPVELNSFYGNYLENEKSIKLILDYNN